MDMHLPAVRSTLASRRSQLSPTSTRHLYAIFEMLFLVESYAMLDVIRSMSSSRALIAVLLASDLYVGTPEPNTDLLLMIVTPRRLVVDARVSRSTKSIHVMFYKYNLRTVEIIQYLTCVLGIVGSKRVQRVRPAIYIRHPSSDQAAVHPSLQATA